MVADINEDGGKRTVQSMPDSMRFHKANVTKEKDWKSLVDATQEAFGSINCLVNNAGTTYRNKGRLLSSSVRVFPANAYCSRP